MTRSRTTYKAPRGTKFSRSRVVWDAPSLEAAAPPVQLSWQSEPAGLVETAHVVEDAVGALTITSRIEAHGPDGTRLIYTYLVESDPVLRTRLVTITDHVAGTTLSLTSNGRGDWLDGERTVPELQGALDIDLTVTPLTNSLPMRRIGLEVGESRDLLVAHIDAQPLRISTSAQRYTRLGRTAYLFRLSDGSFERELATDDAGYVLDYPGLFSRR